MALSVKTRESNSIILHATTGKINDTFVGLKVYGKNIRFCFPYKYQLGIGINKSDLNNNNDYILKPKDNLSLLSEDVILILKSIELAKTHNRENIKINNVDSHDGNIDINAYLWLIRDYLSNGFYINREKTFQANQNGKVNWKRTMKNQPIISKGNIIYKDIVVESKSKADDLILKIHKYCIRKALNLFGWLFKLDSSFIEPVFFDNNVKKLFVATLINELGKTFDDIKRLRLTYMLYVIEDSLEDDSKAETLYGVDNYNYVYERMIDHLFDGEKNISDYYPSATWFLKTKGYKAQKSSDLRPDTIVIDRTNNIAYVLDAKNYLEDLPTTESVQKQITYGDYIKNNNIKEIKEVRSAFIIPYNKKDNSFGFSGNLEYYGYAKPNWRDGKKHHEVIHAFLIDLRFLISNWRSKKCKDYTTELIKDIEDAVKSREE